MMTNILLWGPDGSVLLAAAKIICGEKDIPYTIEKAPAPDPALPAAQRARFLLLQSPGLRDGGFCLFTAEAIWRYLDDAFPGPVLMPRHARERGLVSEMLAIMKDYVIEPAIGVLVAQRLLYPRFGLPMGEKECQSAFTILKDALSVLEQLSLLAHDGEKSEFLIGEDISLADIVLMPVFFYIEQIQEAAELLHFSPRLARWWLTVQKRNSMSKAIIDLQKLVPAHGQEG